MIIGGVLFGAMAATTTGSRRRSASRSTGGLGKVSFWCWLVGFYLAFMPLYVLGLMGMTRRLQHIADLELAAVADRRGDRRGRHLLRHRRHDRAARTSASATRESRRDLTGDPWNGSTLEWSTPSPPPAYNFAVLPEGRIARRLLGDEAARPGPRRSRRYEPIEVPRNSPNGFVTAFFAVTRVSR